VLDELDSLRSRLRRVEVEDWVLASDVDDIIALLRKLDIYNQYMGYLFYNMGVPLDPETIDLIWEISAMIDNLVEVYFGDFILPELWNPINIVLRKEYELLQEFMKYRVVRVPDTSSGYGVWAFRVFQNQDPTLVGWGVPKIYRATYQAIYDYYQQYIYSYFKMQKPSPDTPLADVSQYAYLDTGKIVDILRNIRLRNENFGTNVYATDSKGVRIGVNRVGRILIAFEDRHDTGGADYDYFDIHVEIGLESAGLRLRVWDADHSDTNTIYYKGTKIVTLTGFSTSKAILRKDVLLDPQTGDIIQVLL